MSTAPNPVACTVLSSDGRRAACGQAVGTVTAPCQWGQELVPAGLYGHRTGGQWAGAGT